MLGKYIKDIPKWELDVIEVVNIKTTIAYDNAQNLANNLVAQDSSIAIRILNNFCHQIPKTTNCIFVFASTNINSQPILKSQKK